MVSLISPWVGEAGGRLLPGLKGLPTSCGGLGSGYEFAGAESHFRIVFSIRAHAAGSASMTGSLKASPSSVDPAPMVSSIALVGWEA